MTEAEAAEAVAEAEAEVACTDNRTDADADEQLVACCVCFEQVPQLLYPCGHLSCARCFACLREKTCPSCRADLYDVMFVDLDISLAAPEKGAASRAQAQHQ